MKEPTIRPFVAIGLCIFFVCFFAFLVIAILSGMIGGFDSSIIDGVQSLETPWLTSIMKAFTFIGSTIGVILLALAMSVLLARKFGERNRAYFFFFTVIGSIYLFHSLKFIFKRERPEIHRLTEVGGYSFPSGHATMNFSLYVLFTYLLWRYVQSTPARIALAAFAIFMVGMIAMSRIYLGVHYPSDVLGGLVASALWITLATFLFEKRKKRRLVQD